MRIKPAATSLLLRTFATGTLLAWVCSHALCAQICSSDGNTSDSESTHCHAADADSHHHDHDSPAPSHHGPCASPSCLTLQNALLDSQVVAPTPDLCPLYALQAYAPTLDTADAESRPIFRQAKPRDWVFTPEVCLGPAFRSLAPPSLRPA